MHICLCKSVYYCENNCFSSLIKINCSKPSSHLAIEKGGFWAIEKGVLATNPLLSPRCYTAYMLIVRELYSAYSSTENYKVNNKRDKELSFFIKAQNSKKELRSLQGRRIISLSACIQCCVPEAGQPPWQLCLLEMCNEPRQ